MEKESIQKRLQTIDQYKQENKAAKGMLKGELENSVEYVEAEQEAKEMTLKKKRLRDEIYNMPANQKLLEEIKHNNEEIATLEEILSAELFESYKENNVDEVVDHNGETRKFKIVVKLLPKTFENFK
jgi:hypothetical protein